MSIEAVTWALSVPIGGNAKVVLLGLANHAHPDGTETYPALDTLAAYAACDRSTARRNVRKLVAEGWAVEDGLGPKGQTKYRLALGGRKVPPVPPAPEGGGTSTSEGVAPVPPEPSLGTVQNQRPPSGRARGQADPDELPADFPEELTAALDEVVRTLGHVVEVRGGRPVARAAVARAMVKRPRKPHAAVAERVEHWLLYGKGSTRPTSDVVARWRDWCDGEADVIVGRPEVAALAGGGGVVRPLRRHGRSTMADYQALKGTIG